MLKIDLFFGLKGNSKTLYSPSLNNYFIDFRLLNLGPMTIEEFLLALDQQRLVSFLSGINPDESIPESIHQKLIDFLKLFWIVGGMPAAVAAYRDYKSFRHSNREHGSILQTFEEDFSKYRKRIYPQRSGKFFIEHRRWWARSLSMSVLILMGDQKIWRSHLIYWKWQASFTEFTIVLATVFLLARR